MKIELVHDSAVPLYHQIAEAVQFRIAIGELRPGDALPTLRRASEDLGVNLHTVGRAYRELRERGLVETAGRGGTRVIESALGTRLSAPDVAALDAFLERTVREARREHGLMITDLTHLLANWTGRASEAPPSVSVVECSERQCVEHAVEIESKWAVTAVPWPLDPAREPPPGPIVATYFHYHEVRQSWPHRRGDLHFVAIRPDPDLPGRLPTRRGPDPVAAIVCEFDEPKAVNTVAELALLMPPSDFVLRPVVSVRAGELLESEETVPVIFPPRVWAALTDEERGHERAHHLRFFIDPEELEQLGAELDWRERAQRGVA